jgi:integrase
MKFAKLSDLDNWNPARDEVAWDATLPGFGLRRRRPDAPLRGLVKYWFAGKQQKESLGAVAKVGLAGLRAAARQRFAQLELGVNPAAERARVKAAAAANQLTLADVAGRYLSAMEGIRRPATLRAARWHLGTLWAPLAGRPIADITRADVAARLGDIARTSGRVSAARARGTLSALFAWSIGEGLCESNPVVGTNNPAEGVKPRERILEGWELAAVWRACAGDTDFERIVRLLILLGCRRQEIGGLRWDEVNLDTGVVCIDGSRTKSGQPLKLTLPDLALDILHGVEPRPDNPHLFGTSSRGYTAWSFSQATLNVRIAADLGRPLAAAWSPHDLRRSMRTGLGRLGIRPDVAERCVGHLTGSKVQRTYDRHDYGPEIAAALQAWADHVAIVVADPAGKVVALRPQGA